jgi:hypothetical protein
MCGRRVPGTGIGDSRGEEIKMSHEQAPVSYDVHHRIRYMPASQVHLCDTECVRKWLLAHRRIFRHAAYLDQIVRPALDCSHCGWCGTLISVPAHGHCEFHGADCPGWDWRAAACAPIAIRELAKRNGRPLPPRAFAYAEQVATDLHATYQWPNLVRLVDTVWDHRIDWA